MPITMPMRLSLPRNFVLCIAMLVAAAPMLSGPEAIAASSDEGLKQLFHVGENVQNLQDHNFVSDPDVPPRIAGAEPSPRALGLRYLIRGVTVAGSTVYKAIDLEPLIKPYLGRANTLVELYALADDIAAKYRADGYPFTRVVVPGQHIVRQQLQINVTELNISDVAFTLDDKTIPTPVPLQPAVAEILAAHPVTLRALQRAETVARGLADVRVATTQIQQRGDGASGLTVMLSRPGDGSIAIQPSDGAAARDGGTEARPILVREIRVTGNHALGSAELAAILTPFVGRTMTVAELGAVARQIEARYAAAGYFGTTASVPPQVVRNGLVTLAVAELSIGRVDVFVNDSKLPDDDLLSRAANRVAEQKPATTQAVQRQLYILNNIPGVLVQNIIPPVPGAPNAELYLKRKPWTLITAMDNRGTQVSGPLEVGALLQEDGQLGLNEEIQLLGLKTIPWKQVTYSGLQAVLPLTDSGLVANAMISHTEAQPGGFLAPLDLVALGDMLSVGLSYPVLARANLTSLITLQFDAFNNSTTVFGGRITSSDERSRALRFGSTSIVDDPYGGTANIKLVYSQGLNSLGARPNGLQVNSNPGMRLDAGKIVFDVRHDLPLGGGFKLSTGFKLQRAFAPLPSGEVMTFGGVIFGRAFDSGIISGDHGMAGKIQLSRAMPLGNPVLPFIEPYIFYDNGETFSIQKTAGVPSSASAASTGIGTRFVTGLGVGGSIEVDLPLTRRAKSNTLRKPARIFFLLYNQF